MKKLNINGNKNLKEKGISLPITLFILISVLISAMLLIRAGDVSLNVAGNIGSHTQISGSNNEATIDAINWLVNNKATLNNSNGTFYTSAYPATNIDFTADSSWVNAQSFTGSDGVQSQYIIYRKCTLANLAYNGSAGGVQNVCTTDAGNASSGNTSSNGYDSYNFSANYTGIMLYYQILVRTQTTGAKGASVITETIVKV